MTRQRYTAHCEWDETGWWVVTVPELAGAVTQSRRLDQVPGDVAEVIQLLTDKGPEAYELDVEAHVPGAVGEEASHAAELRAAADRLSQEAQEATAKAVRTLRAAGLTVRDVGSLLGVSFQRVQQLSARNGASGEGSAEVG